MDRREMIAGLGGALTVGLAGARHGPGQRAPTIAQPAAFPRKADFRIEPRVTYLNAAFTHPIPLVAVDAARRAAEARGTLRPAAPPTGRGGVPGAPNPRAQFAALIGAKPTEVAYVSSTSAGENLVVRALGLDHRRDGNVVTDGLHFEGALMHLAELGKRGLDVRVVPPSADGRVTLGALDRVIDRNTRLVQVSAVAMYNGFRHDLKAICDLAHSRGAMVYADVVHLVGAAPFQVRESGVDFAATSSFKWLMGDFGLGFLYVSEAALDRIERPVVGYYQAPSLHAHYPPFGFAPGASDYRAVTYDIPRTAAGMFEMGTLTGSTEVNVALLAASLGYVQTLGPAAIHAHRLPLLERLQDEVPKLGFRAMTPREDMVGVVTFAREHLGSSDVAGRLLAAGVNVRLADHWMRVSPSVYNDMEDVERLLAALK